MIRGSVAARRALARLGEPRRPAVPLRPPADLIVHECQQGTEEWHDVRRGMLSASVMSKIMAESEERKGRASLMRTLAGERITGLTAESFQSEAMKRGHRDEPEARRWYERSRFVEIRQVGFIVDPDLNAGWSPDGLVDDDGAVEFKSAAPNVMVGILDRATTPPEHRPQCQGGLLIGRRKWIDLVIYCARMKPAVFRITPDPIYQQQMRDEIEKFNYELKMLIKKIGAQ